MSNLPLGTIDISGLDPVIILQTLYANAKANTLNTSPITLSYEEAEFMLNRDHGDIKKIYDKDILIVFNLESNKIFPGWYDLAHGKVSIFDPIKKQHRQMGTCQSLILQLRNNLR